MSVIVEFSLHLYRHTHTQKRYNWFLSAEQVPRYMIIALREHSDFINYIWSVSEVSALKSLHAWMYDSDFQFCSSGRENSEWLGFLSLLKENIQTQMLPWECSTTRALKYLQFLAAHHSSIPGKPLMQYSQYFVMLPKYFLCNLASLQKKQKLISQKSSDSVLILVV